MIEKVKEKKKAVSLRKQGRSYNEILEEVDVAKSILSRWLKNVGLSKPQKQRITQKRIENQKKAAKRTREIRIEKTKKIFKKAQEDFDDLNICNKSEFLLGVMLYWCEGYKPSKRDVSATVDLGNTDPVIIKFFVYWLKKYLNIKDADITYRLAIHETADIKKSKKYWRKILKLPKSKKFFLYIKTHNPKTNRKNTGKDYYGLIQIRVRRSTDINRKIFGWIKTLGGKII